MAIITSFLKFPNLNDELLRAVSNAVSWFWRRSAACANASAMLPVGGGLNPVCHLLVSYWLPLYSGLYGGQLPAVMCTLHVRVAQVPNA